MKGFQQAVQVAVAALIIGGIYGLIEWTSLKCLIHDGIGTVAMFWAPAGVLLGLFTRLPRRFWTATLIMLTGVNFVVNHQFGGRDVLTCILLAAPDVACPVLGGIFLRRQLDPRCRLGTVREVILLLVTILLVTAGSTLTAAGVKWISHWGGAWEPFLFAWSTAVGLGALMVAPTLICFGLKRRSHRSAVSVGEQLIIQLLLATVTLALFTTSPERAASIRPLMFAPVPLHFLATVRGGPIGAAIGSLILGMIGTVQTARGFGPVGIPGSVHHEGFTWLQAYMAVAAMASQFLAAIVEEHRQALRARENQNRILEMVAAGAPLEQSTRNLVLTIEESVPGMLGSILRLDEDGATMRILAAPSMAAEYNRFVDGIQAGPSVGSCGTAVHRRERVIVTDIETDPLWSSFVDQVRPYGLKACWSQPIMGANGKVLGTFAMYYREVRTPNPREIRLIESAARLAGIAIERTSYEQNLRERETAYSSLLANLSGVVYRLKVNLGGSPPFVPVYLSDGVTAMCGYRGDEIIHSRFIEPIDLVHPDDRKRVRERRVAAVETREPLEMEYRMVTRHGREKWVLDQSHFIFDQRGKPLFMEGMLTDITLRKRAEESAERARAEAVHANRAKDQFLAMLSHELRTPLTPVLLYASSIEQQPNLPDELREEIGIIRQQIEHERGLIDDLLDVTRIQRGKFPIERTSMDLSDVVRRVAEVNYDLLREKELALSVELSASHHKLSADPGRMQQMINNLLSNAIKFTPPGGKIRIRTESDSTDRLKLTITDSGIGITAADLPRLFHPFEQGMRARSPEYGGLGLGLTIVKAIVELHGGTITAHSEGDGKGTTFVVTLPQQAEADSCAPQPAPAPAPMRKLRILLVEDHAVTREALHRALSAAGHEVESADSVQAALQLAEQKFDLMICDIQLPDGTGHDLLRQIRLKQPLRAIAFSGFGSDEDFARSSDAGFAAHLVKPVKVETMFRCISDVTNAAT